MRYDRGGGPRPANGWHAQFRHHVSVGDICLRCYEAEILKHGQSRDDFLRSGIAGGMFFSRGNLEPKAAGFHEFPEFSGYFVSDQQHARSYNQHALALLDFGEQVLMAHETLAIGGLEGYITMMARNQSGVR